MWEYLTLRKMIPLSDKDLNHYGMEGWELVAVYQDKRTTLLAPDIEVDDSRIIYYFKRKKNE